MKWLKSAIVLLLLSFPLAGTAQARSHFGFYIGGSGPGYSGYVYDYPAPIVHRYYYGYPYGYYEPYYAPYYNPYAPGYYYYYYGGGSHHHHHHVYSSRVRVYSHHHHR